MLFYLCGAVIPHDTASDHLVGEVHLHNSAADVLDLRSLFDAQSSAVDARGGRSPVRRAANHAAFEREISGRRGRRDAGQVVDDAVQLRVAHGRARVHQLVQAGEVDRQRKSRVLTGATGKRTEKTVGNERRRLKLSDRQSPARLVRTHRKVQVSTVRYTVNIKISNITLLETGIDLNANTASFF